MFPPKACSKCCIVKPLSEFYASSGMRDGHRNDCKLCNLAAKKRRYDANPEVAIDRVRKWQDDNPERVRETRRRRNAHPDRQRKLRDSPDLLLRALVYLRQRRAPDVMTAS